MLIMMPQHTLGKDLLNEDVSEVDIIPPMVSMITVTSYSLSNSKPCVTSSSTTVPIDTK